MLATLESVRRCRLPNGAAYGFRRIETAKLYQPSTIIENTRIHFKTYFAHFNFEKTCEYFTHLSVCVHSDASEMQRQWKLSKPNLSETTTLDAPWLLAKFKTCNASTVCCCRAKFTIARMVHKLILKVHRLLGDIFSSMRSIFDAR